jgi:acetyl-CoA decarbonylase/synthase complex subunit gamma
MRYQVKPGLYAAGNPTAESSVFVSANYKMSFDRLRSALDGIDGWILVLDTKGINVWCAAGKGTFGTDELVRRIDDTGLSSVVSHKRLIVPQLGAPGVAAHEVKERSGFRVVYGPVRASDIRPFLQAAMKATPEMRRVEFPLSDRLATAPVELVISAKWVLTIALAFLLLAGLGSDGYSWARVAREGVLSAALFAGTFAAGTILTPALLPWLPGRALSLKGAWIGAALLPVFAALLWIFQAMPTDWLNVAAWCILIPLTTSVAAMSFTGATTYTSLSGVRREMKIAVPIQAVAAVVGVVIWLAGRFTLS